MQPLAAMTWEEARDAAGAGSAAILPVGAIEAHGPHLPLETDVIIARRWRGPAPSGWRRAGLPWWCCRRSATPRRPSPRVSPGTLSLRPETVTATVVDIAGSLARHGFGVLAIANAHLDPGHLALARRGRERDPARPRAGGGVSQSRHQALGPPPGRRVPERRLPRRPVRDLDRAGRASGAGAGRHPGGAAAPIRRRSPAPSGTASGASRRRAAPGPTSGLRRRPPPRRAAPRSTTLGGMLDEAVQAELGARAGQANESTAGRVAVVTGAGRGIGAATARPWRTPGSAWCSPPAPGTRSSGRPLSWRRQGREPRRWCAT